MNILILTKIYPAEDIPYSDTPVVHYFTKQWKEMGHEVRVVHNLIQFPLIVSLISNFFLKALTSKIGSVIPAFRDNIIRQYIYDDIKVLRIPIKKVIPHGWIKKERIEKSFHVISESLDKEHYVPDIIVAHWWSPQLELLSLLKHRYKCKTCLVIHDVDKSKRTIDGKSLQNIDIFGCRSIPLQKEFEAIWGDAYKTFHCPSGIPEAFIVGASHRDFTKGVSSICYVGSLISRKHPQAIMGALRRLSPNPYRCLTYIGTGAELKKLKNCATKHLTKVKVVFSGKKVPRKEVTEHLKQADVFVMISEREAFGLVYLEAMGSGCITIASKNEGMDGIIEHGVNGYLCEAGNETELAAILEKIHKLSATERRSIALKAVETAKRHTDFLVAKHYLESVVNS